MSSDRSASSEGALKRHQKKMAELAEKRRKSIDSIGNTCTKLLSVALEKNEISGSELKLAEEALLLLSIGRHQAEQIRSALTSLDPILSDKFDHMLAFIVRGTYLSGGLVISSKTLRRNRTRTALGKIEEVRDLHLEAIRYALSQPPSRPFGKSRGTSAMADRALKAANQWLQDNGHDANLTVNAIQKRLERSPDDFPPSDRWQK